MQDAIVIAVAVGAALWLAWRTARRLAAPGCGAPAAGQPGTGSFVSLDRLVASAARRPRDERRTPHA
jgi:hypothetical protein